MGVVIMLGWLFGIIALAYGLVWRFDPEARRAPGDPTERFDQPEQPERPGQPERVDGEGDR